MPGLHQYLRYCTDRATGERYQAQEARDGTGYILLPVGFGGGAESRVNREDFEDRFEWSDAEDLFDIRQD
jgi:hypothetical protein